MVEERGGVIGLLQREVEDLKAALKGAETRASAPVDPPTPVVDPRLEQDLAKVCMVYHLYRLKWYTSYVRPCFAVRCRRRCQGRTGKGVGYHVNRSLETLEQQEQLYLF